EGVVVKEAVVVGIGTFLATIVDFILVAFIVFLIVKAFNKARDIAEKKKREEEAAKAAAEAAAKAEEPPKPTTEELLAEILAELRKQNG
ncbi:MAG: MscL family protein, partial [Eubacteriales bacterium]|nr:MscL family protein [Eubacteriales bacterium]